MTEAFSQVRRGVTRAVSPVARFGHPALRSLEGNLASPSWLRSVSDAGSTARATPRGSAMLRRSRGRVREEFPLAVVFTAALLIVAAGCGGPVRRAVAGSVTLDGQPLDEAVIVFVPLDGDSRKAGSRIEAGRYELSQHIGLLPGRYRVEIADDPPIDPGMRPDRQQPRPRRILPVVYSTSSPLAVEVTADGPADFSFDLSSKPAGTP